MKNLDKVLDAIQNHKCGAFGNVTVNWQNSYCHGNYCQFLLHGNRICQMWFPDTMGNFNIGFSCCGFNTNTTKRYLNAILAPYGYKLSNMKGKLHVKHPDGCWQEILATDIFTSIVDGEKTYV